MSFCRENTVKDWIEKWNKDNARTPRQENLEMNGRMESKIIEKIITNKVIELVQDN